MSGWLLPQTEFVLSYQLLSEDLFLVQIPKICGRAENGEGILIFAGKSNISFGSINLGCPFPERHVQLTHPNLPGRYNLIQPICTKHSIFIIKIVIKWLLSARQYSKKREHGDKQDINPCYVK